MYLVANRVLRWPNKTGRRSTWRARKPTPRFPEREAPLPFWWWRAPSPLAIQRHRRGQKKQSTASSDSPQPAATAAKPAAGSEQESPPQRRRVSISVAKIQYSYNAPWGLFDIASAAKALSDNGSVVAEARVTSPMPSGGISSLDVEEVIYPGDGTKEFVPRDRFGSTRKGVSSHITQRAVCYRPSLIGGQWGGEETRRYRRHRGKVLNRLTSPPGLQLLNESFTGFCPFPPATRARS